MKKILSKSLREALFFTVFITVFGYLSEENASLGQYIESEWARFLTILAIMFAVYFVIGYIQFQKDQRKQNLRNHYNKLNNDSI
ncbi:MAG: hypothetical protein K0M56_04580 [Kaistella sp.]|nr:hypothetical protein [Kaistella sp.]